MASMPPLDSNRQSQIAPKQSCELASKYPSSRWIPSSFSSSPCSSHDHSDGSPLGSFTPLRFSGVPFSWEHLPGIPKKQTPKKKESITSSISKHHLPLMPPPTTTPPTSSKRFNFEEKRKNSTIRETSQSDPFLAALVECSKNDDDDSQDQRLQSNPNQVWEVGPKVTRSISGRFGFVNLYASCKRTCAVSESIIYLQKSNRTSYDLIHHRSR